MKRSLILLLILLAVPGVMAGSAVTGGFSDGGGILYTEPVKSVIFNHKTHADEKQISCDRCHSGLFDMEALKVQQRKDFVMESLYRGKYCGACHNGKTAFASDTQCARCHVRADLSKVGYVKGKKPATVSYKTSVAMGKGEKTVRFNHETHTAQAKCSDCHPERFKIKKGSNRIAMADHGRNKYCFGCHDGSKAFSWNDCSRCHAKVTAPDRAVLFGKGDKIVSFNHKTHSGKMSCASCHTKLFSYKKGSAKMTFADHSTSKNCFACHASTGKGSASYDCNRCHAKMSTSASPAGPEQAILFGKGERAVSFNHKTHSGMMSCASCHTKLFSYKKGSAKMTFADHSTNKNCFACHASTGKGSASYDCNRCHATKTKTSTSTSPTGPAQAILFGKGERAVSFSHKTHSGMMSCASCHTKLFSYKQGSAKMTFADHSTSKNCFACHASTGKGSASYDCNRCHKGQASVSPSKDDNKSSCLTCHASGAVMKAMVRPPAVPAEGEG